MNEPNKNEERVNTIFNYLTAIEEFPSEPSDKERLEMFEKTFNFIKIIDDCSEDEITQAVSKLSPDVIEKAVMFYFTAKMQSYQS